MAKLVALPAPASLIDLRKRVAGMLPGRHRVKTTAFRARTGVE